MTCFMEENEISLREVARFDEYKETKFEVKRAVFCLCLIGNIHQFILRVE